MIKSFKQRWPENSLWTQQKEISIAKDKFVWGDSIIFKDESNIIENSKRSESDHNHTQKIKA